MVKVLVPRYMKDFQCIGGDCEDSCCYGWNINLTKTEYTKYRIKNEISGVKVKDNIVKIKDKATDDSYARIKLQGKDKGCPFLTKNGLCGVQIEMGHDFLSNTCRIYPRTINYIDGQYEESATLSCPEIARKALLDKDGIVFELYDVENMDYIINMEMDTSNPNYSGGLEKYFWEIRLFSLNTLMNRDYSIEDRLILLGMAYRKLEKLAATDKVLEELEYLNNLYISNDLSIELSKIEGRPEIQVQILMVLIKMGAITGTRYSEILELLEKAFESDSSMEDRYTYLKTNYYDPKIKSREYIIENFLVNEFFRNLLPFGSYKDVWEAYIILVINYSIVKLLLIGLSYHYEELTDDIFIKAIQVYSRENLHNYNYTSNIKKFIKSNDLDSFAYLSIILKD